jgi:hypothetical protein
MLSMFGHDEAEDQVDHEQPAQLAHERACLPVDDRPMDPLGCEQQPNRPKIAPDAPTATGASLNANETERPAEREQQVEAEEPPSPVHPLDEGPASHRAYMLNSRWSGFW